MGASHTSLPLLLEAIDRYGWELTQYSEYPEGRRQMHWAVRFPGHPEIVVKGCKLVRVLETALCLQSALARTAPVAPAAVQDGTAGPGEAGWLAQDPVQPLVDAVDLVVAELAPNGNIGPETYGKLVAALIEYRRTSLRMNR